MLAVISIFAFQDQISSVIAAEISDSDTVDVTAVVGTPAPPGGGGGGTGSYQQATVIITGNTFPNAKLTLLKDGSVTTTLVANSNGSFQIVINNLTFGNYQFSIFAEDPNGVTSSPYVINVPAFSGIPYTYSGVLLPPTISANITTVQIGQQYIISGYTAPGSTVSLDIPNITNLGTTIAGANGFYQLTVRATLAPGTYFLRSRATLAASTSPYSKPVQITYYTGAGLPPTPPPQYATCVDFNKDGRVNLIDFSILLYWFNKNPVPTTMDCNRDTFVDIKDFSILMYFWTG